MEAASASHTLGKFYQTTRHNIRRTKSLSRLTLPRHHSLTTGSEVNTEQQQHLCQGTQYLYIWNFQLQMWDTKVLTAVRKSVFFWVVTQCRLVGTSHCFEETHCLSIFSPQDVLWSPTVAKSCLKTYPLFSMFIAYVMETHHWNSFWVNSM
jgi:hypothetical protein